MRAKLVSIAASALLAAAGLASAQPYDDDDGPREAPPPIRVENVRPRPGFVWIPGKYEWRHHRWSWVNGHFERVRAGHRWREGHWEQRGDRYVWIDGRWGAAAAVQPVGPTVRDHRH